MPVDALLFDKDGTLFDFAATWSAWTGRLIRDFAKGDPAHASRIAEVLGFDLERETFAPDSVVIAHSNDEIAEALSAVLPGQSAEEIAVYMAESAAEADLVPATDLHDLLDRLIGRGLVLGVMTNDAELSARAQLSAAGVLERFTFVAGCDSGYGAKPDPDPLLAFCEAVGVSPERTAMVGDSAHDLVAGRAAGMRTLGVLTGMAGSEALQPHADAVLPDIGHIPGWLAA
ncbi:MAG: HAD-IA family hydrolase [Rhodobacteraceae bacterium]|nr:HAD-IA family hydrolase [Paracoccaceae bacterium]